MKNYKIIVQYDGTRYKGWQVQKSTDVTIQGKLQMVLSKLAGHPVEVIGSGRTDAGVHASGQVANFHIEEHFSKEQLMETFSNFLPEDADSHKPLQSYADLVYLLISILLFSIYGLCSQ